MATIQINKYLLLASAFLFSFSSVILAKKEPASASIPIIENAKVFADFTDSMPAVVNYFTSATEEQIIDFYQQKLGKTASQERKRGRLTLTYRQEKQTMRVVVSQQNNKRQVDAIVEHIK